MMLLESILTQSLELVGTKTIVRSLSFGQTCVLGFEGVDCEKSQWIGLRWGRSFFGSVGRDRLLTDLCV